MRNKLFIFLFLFFLNFNISYAEINLKSTLDDQTGIEITVYNNNIGLVKDTRKIQLDAGMGELKFMDIASFIMPVTVSVKSLNFPQDFNVLEQNYEYDLMNENKLLDKYVGKKIKIIKENDFKDKKEIIEATLISNREGQIYKIDNEIYLGYPGIKILPEIPENLIANPTLMWLYNNKNKQLHEIEVLYITNNISWKADYVFKINNEDSLGDLSGWVTLDNKSGAIYKNASLKLVSGEVNLIKEESVRTSGSRRLYKMAAMEASQQFEEKSFFEYHIYDLQRKTTIRDNQTKQISLLDGYNIKIEKEYVLNNVSNNFIYRVFEKNTKQPVDVYINFENNKNNNLGMPLPAGTIRLYKEDDSKKLQFIGEDKISHTPKDEKVRLKIGEAFDVVAERKQTSYKQLSQQEHETEWEILIKNHKDEDVTVGIIEPLIGDWTIEKNNYSYNKIDAFKVKFDVLVSKNSEIKVIYKVKVKL